MTIVEIIFAAFVVYATYWLLRIAWKGFKD